MNFTQPRYDKVFFQGIAMLDSMDLPDGVIRIPRLVISKRTGDWCQLPYPGHSKGCPMYNKKEGCPPIAPFITDIIDVEKPMYFAYSEFDLNSHRNKMKRLHPSWSERQCNCVLYWQPKSRKQMEIRAYSGMNVTGCNFITTCPEGMGVNVFATFKEAGISLDKTRNISICRHTSLLGFKNT